MATEDDRIDQILTTLDSEDAGASTAASPEDEVLQRLDAGDGAPDQGAGETAPDTTTEAVEPEPQAQAIDPPASWKAEWKDQFKALPPEAQKIIAERESERERGITKSQQESADARKAAEAERAAVQSERQAYANRLNVLIDMANTMDPVLAEGRKTDWVALSAKDPAGAQTKWFQYQQRNAELQALEQERNTAVQRMRNDAFQQGHKLLTEKLDFWADNDKRTAFQSEFGKYLVDQGFKPEEASNIEDPRAMLLGRKAMLYDQLMAKQAAIPLAKKTTAPGKVMRPQAQDEGNKDARAEALKRTAIKSGRTEDVAAAVLAAL